MQTYFKVIDLDMKKLIKRSPSLARCSSSELKGNAAIKYIYDYEIKIIKDMLSKDYPSINKDDIKLTFKKSVDGLKLILLAETSPLIFSQQSHQ